MIHYDIGAKATVLGGAFSAKVDDFSAIYYNPAGLVQIKRPEISEHTDLWNHRKVLAAPTAAIAFSDKLFIGAGFCFW